jgi:hypothetical protein
MRRYDCKGSLKVTIDEDRMDNEQYIVHAILEHESKHPSYVFTSAPKEAIEKMKKMLDYSPTEVATSLRKKRKHSQQKQIYRLWSQLCEATWRHDANPMNSARHLIREEPSVDLSELTVLEGVRSESAKDT